MSHTPGPWIVEAADQGDGAFVRMSNGRTLATFGTSSEIGIGLDNARLIAAAPDLLAAVKASIAQIEDTDWTGLPDGLRARFQAHEIYLREKLAKAEGR